MNTSSLIVPLTWNKYSSVTLLKVGVRLKGVKESLDGLKYLLILCLQKKNNIKSQTLKHISNNVKYACHRSTYRYLSHHRKTITSSWVECYSNMEKCTNTNKSSKTNGVSYLPHHEPDQASVCAVP